MTLSTQASNATSITIPYVFVPNTTIFSAQVNADFSVIASVVNGNLDNSNISAGANIALSKLNKTTPFVILESTGLVGVGAGITADTFPRGAIYSDGSIRFGTGALTGDVGLQRSAAGTLQLYTPTGTPVNPVLDMNHGSIINIGPVSGSTVAPIQGGRLYLTSGSPNVDHAASTNLFYGPAINNVITLYNGTSQVPQTFAETTYSTGALATGVYDVYVSSLTSTTIAINTVAWGGLNTPPTRGVDSYGRLTQNATPTALLVGAIYVNGSNQVTDNIATRGVSNLYNQISRAMFATDTAPTWSYGSTTIRPADANTTDGVGRVSFVAVLPNQAVRAECYCFATAGGAGTAAYIGIGVNSTTAFTNWVPTYISTTAGVGTGTATYSASSLMGYTFLQRLEAAAASTTFGSSNFAGNANGLSAAISN